MEAVHGLFSFFRAAPKLQEGTFKASQTTSDTESTFESTDAGELSDHSPDSPQRSPDGSDSETPTTALMANGVIAPPPGLEAPFEVTMEANRAPYYGLLNSHAPCFVPSSTLSPHAPLFVPSFGATSCAVAAPPALSDIRATPQGKKSSKPTPEVAALLKRLLQECETSMPEGHNDFQQQQTANDDQAFSALQEVYSRLTPADAGVLRTFLESREQRENEARRVGCREEWGSSVGQQLAPPPSDPLLQSWLSATLMGMTDLNTGIAAGHPQPIVVMPSPVMPVVQFPPYVPAAPMVPPPGAFCYNPQPTMAPSHFMPPVAPKAASGQVQSSSPCGSKPAGPTKSKKSRETGKKITAPKPAEPADDAKETLRKNLRDLSLLDHERVLMVRKINLLGLESPKFLEAYFSKFGAVDQVMVSHSKAKSMFGRKEARVRAAGLGFLVMSTADEVKSILAVGAEHEISGVTISISPFESRDDPQTQ